MPASAAHGGAWARSVLKTNVASRWSSAVPSCLRMQQTSATLLLPHGGGACNRMLAHLPRDSWLLTPAAAAGPAPDAEAVPGGGLCTCSCGREGACTHMAQQMLSTPSHSARQLQDPDTCSITGGRT